MAAGYPVYFGGTQIRTSEALYQACRFPDHPDIQREIIDQRSPMTAKDISRKYNYLTRKDWNDKRVAIMNWCIHLKLLYNWNKFGRLLMSTGTGKLSNYHQRMISGEPMKEAISPKAAMYWECF